MPFVLEQMSYEPKDLPTIILKDVPLFEAIELPANEVFELHGYEPHRWKSKAVMAAQFVIKQEKKSVIPSNPTMHFF